MSKIKKLGLKEEDSHILYQTKIDWTAVYSDNNIYCAEHKCDFFTKIDNEELTNHMITVHKYGEYNCENPPCNYVGHSQKNLNIHKVMHTTQPNKTHFHKCPICETSFRTQANLDSHLRIHNNDLDLCHYCPFCYEKSDNYKRHLKNHFGIKDFECDRCDKTFTTNSGLKQHHELHDGIIHCCLICNGYETRQKDTIQHHLKRKHSELLKNQKVD